MAMSNYIVREFSRGRLKVASRHIRDPSEKVKKMARFPNSRETSGVFAVNSTFHFHEWSDMDKRVIMRVEVDVESKKELDEFCDRTGMTKVAAVSRLIDWFCRQPHGIQAILQGLLPSPIQEEIAHLILENLASKNGNGRDGHKRDGYAISKRMNGHDGHMSLTKPKHNGAKR
jgi:hypothetical protein